jgi:MFS family permease
MLQGVSAGAGVIAGRAVIRDLLDGVSAQRLMSHVAMVFAIAPAIAPMIGGVIDDALGWRAIFGFLTIVALALAAINAAGTGLLSQLAPLLEERGLTAAGAAQALSVYAGGLIVGRLGCGALLDRLPAARVAATFTLGPALGCALLFSGTPALAFAAAALIGIQQGAETDVLAWFVSRVFGMRCYGAIFGAVLTIGYTGTIIGILLIGRSYDWTGDYDIAVITAGAAFVVGALGFLLIGRPAHHAHAATARP